MNEDAIGDEPHWDDVARDILQLVNHFQDEMPHPLIGIGQSWGGYPVFQAALYHPRLFTAVVGLEPFVSLGGPKKRNMSFAGVTVFAMAKRRDTWNSREEARKALLKNPYFQAFDPEVFELVMKHDFLELPRPVGAKDTPVTLKTPKAMEVVTMMRLEPGQGLCNEDSELEYDKDSPGEILPGFYRVEPQIMQPRLAKIRPAVLYCFGTDSTLPKKQDWLQELLKITGAGRGGNGGAATGNVEGVWIEGAGHPMPLEKPKLTAEKMVPFLGKQLKSWEEREMRYEEEKGEMWTKTINPTWTKKMFSL
jgi:pimeloyl-ACP methyl ester carboxylesterase